MIQFYITNLIMSIPALRRRFFPTLQDAREMVDRLADTYAAISAREEAESDRLDDLADRLENKATQSRHLATDAWRRRENALGAASKLKNF